MNASLSSKRTSGKIRIIQISSPYSSAFEQGYIGGTTITSAHLYIDALRRLDELVQSSDSVLLITSHKECATIFKANRKANQFN